ncbi:hypothetical protein DFP72DRAFT_1041175 [Ephemerocybe angulata]|uniref:RING-type domain-containing protein n=1 Tax=Ephemerocybe angulata TaxID=980116 RepID=A0A8H6IEY1_9AGAR|nr:hypothetical protein DFP72DRAFT_1041175 [Tulosesus angulatus]
MDIELKCNRLTCRTTLTDKAVVSTGSHIFCVDCANELFNASRLCPACETSLTEPDDVVVCSLQPTNDYKTVRLPDSPSRKSPPFINARSLFCLGYLLRRSWRYVAGNAPRSTSLFTRGGHSSPGLCPSSISFWQYQIHQESSFQQAVVRSVNDKNSQLQRQLDNVVREANSQIELLMGKKSELERDLEFERKKVRELQEASREQSKEYQKLKAQHDKIKRKALLGASVGGNVQTNVGHPEASQGTGLTHLSEGFARNNARTFVSGGNNIGAGHNIGGMIQRTPIGPTGNGPRGFQPQPPGDLAAQRNRQVGHSVHRQQFTAAPMTERSFPALSERSTSANEVENLLMYQQPPSVSRGTPQSGWGQPPNRPSGNLEDESRKIKISSISKFVMVVINEYMIFCLWNERSRMEEVMQKETRDCDRVY